MPDSPSIPGGAQPCPTDKDGKPDRGWFHYFGRWFHHTWGYERRPEDAAPPPGPDDVFL